jgi:hypothetical protein
MEKVNFIALDFKNEALFSKKKEKNFNVRLKVHPVFAIK